jgi:hypothetical protein
MGVDDEDLLRFEAGVHENGVAWWSARWLMDLLGYATWASFKNVLTHALSSCMTLGLDASRRPPNGSSGTPWMDSSKRRRWRGALGRRCGR